MNKYELALVVSANVEDEVRTATIEKVNASPHFRSGELPLLPGKKMLRG